MKAERPLKIIIVGAGTVGFQLAKELIQEKRNVVVIEQDTTNAQYVADRLDCLVINDKGTNMEVLRSAGADKADFLISVTDSDEINMIACALAHSEFSVPHKIARVRNIEYSETRMLEHRLLGIDYIVNPEVVAAHAIIRSINVGALSDVLVFERSAIQMRNLVVDRNSVLLGKAVKEIAQLITLPFLIVLLNRGNEVLIPSGENTIIENDVLYIAASEKTFEALYKQIGYKKQELRRIILTGGGRIGTHIAHALLHTSDRGDSLIKRMIRRIVPDRHLTIVEYDPEKCRRLSEQFPKALVLNANISDESLFEEEHFATADLFIATTEDEELNMVTAIYAKTLGISRSIVLVSKKNYSSIASRLGIDVVVSLKNTVVSTILKFIRRGTVSSIHSILDGVTKIIEFTVHQDSSAVGQRIQDIKLPPPTLIVAINRKGSDYIPSGDYIINAEDHIITIVKKESAARVQQIFVPVST